MKRMGIYKAKWRVVINEDEYEIHTVDGRFVTVSYNWYLACHIIKLHNASLEGKDTLVDIPVGKKIKVRMRKNTTLKPCEVAES